MPRLRESSLRGSSRTRRSRTRAEAARLEAARAEALEPKQRVSRPLSRRAARTEAARAEAARAEAARADSCSRRSCAGRGCDERTGPKLPKRMRDGMRGVGRWDGSWTRRPAGVKLPRLQRTSPPRCSLVEQPASIPALRSAPTQRGARPLCERVEPEDRANMTIDMVREAAKQPHTNPVVRWPFVATARWSPVTFRCIQRRCGHRPGDTARRAEARRRTRCSRRPWHSSIDVIEIRRNVALRRGDPARLITSAGLAAPWGASPRRGLSLTHATELDVHGEGRDRDSRLPEEAAVGIDDGPTLMASPIPSPLPLVLTKCSNIRSMSAAPRQRPSR
jgi:hypothetical protein